MKKPAPEITTARWWNLLRGASLRRSLTVGGTGGLFGEIRVDHRIEEHRPGRHRMSTMSLESDGKVTSR